MDPNEKKALINCRVFFMENVHDVHNILDDFIQAGISSDVIEEITAQLTPSRRKQTFLTVLPTWGSDAFNVLLKALNRTGCDHVSVKLEEELEIIKQTRPCLCSKNTTPSWLSQQVGNMTVSEHALHLLAQELSPSVFFLLGSCLGLSNGRLQQLQANHPNTVSLQFSNMLCEWRSTQGSQAVVKSLVEALHQTRVDENLYMDILLDDTGVLKGQSPDHIQLMNSISTSISSREQWV